ncbi:exopolyphosphatase [candidate division KSB1 bacterium]
MRLITRGDADGLGCAVFITMMEKVDSIVFANPKEMQDGRVDVRRGDIICNLPYHPDCYMWFDHHISEETRDKNVKAKKFKGKFGMAPSAARLVYEYYNDIKLKKFEDFLLAVDKLDSAQLDVTDITDPKGWMLLMTSLDPRASLGNYENYFKELVEWIKKLSLEEILEEIEVQLRCEYVLSDLENYKNVLQENTTIDENVIVIDFRNMNLVPIGNRFYEYILFPEGNISVRLFWGKGKRKIICAVGHSIFKRDSNTNIGKLLKRYGGGGLRGAGTCQLDPETADMRIAEIIHRLKKDG